VEAECGIPPEAQTLLHNGQPLADLKKTLADYNVREHDIILVVANQTSAQQPIRSVQQQRGQFGTSPLANDWVEQLRQQMLSDPQLQRQISVQNPALLAAAQSADPSQFRRLIEQVAAQQRQQQLTQRQELERLHADPFDVESQQKIAEMIRMQRVQENMEAAMEHNPEAFGRVIMLYIDCEVNGHKVKAFVDSGAQATICKLKK
jgi:DNA damage-inducible protein 1